MYTVGILAYLFNQSEVRHYYTHLNKVNYETLNQEHSINIRTNIHNCGDEESVKSCLLYTSISSKGMLLSLCIMVLKAASLCCIGWLEVLCISVSVVVGFLYRYILNLCMCSNFVMERSRTFMLLLCLYSAVKVFVYFVYVG